MIKTKNAKIIITVFSLICILLPVKAPCSVECIDAEGEAPIMNNDVSAAKMEAVARAKWAAIGQTIGMEIKVKTVVQNNALIDEVVIKKINGVVAGFKVLREENKKDTYLVKSNVCIESANAKEAALSLALNNRIGVFIIVKKQSPVDTYEETNVLSEKLTGKLIEHGYSVIDAVPAQVPGTQGIEDAIQSGNYTSLRAIMYRYLSNVLVVGKADYTVATGKGDNIGYNISMPFQHVVTRLTYRIFTRDSSGKIVVLSAGVEQGKGLANDLDEAVQRGLEDLAEKIGPKIADKLNEYIKGIAKKVSVKIVGLADMSENFAVKETLQNIAWVTKVQEKGLGEFLVDYQENPVYLANSMSLKKEFRIEEFSPYSITVKYVK